MVDLNRAISIAPDNHDACIQLDHVLARNGRFDIVVTHWTRFLAVRPDHGRAHFERGGAYYNMRKMQPALADAKQACSLGYEQGCAVVRRIESRPR